MGLKQRLISKLLLENGVAVKYKHFTGHRRVVGDPVSTMRTMADQTLDEFLICDLGVISPTLVREMTEPVFVPVTVAGSIHSMSQVDELIRDCGVEKVVIKNAAIGHKVAVRYGRQAVVWPHDYHGAASRWIAPPPWAGEVLLTSIDRDGTGVGFDLDVLRAVYNIPVVVAGGCGKLMHVKQAFDVGASGVAVASMFAFTDKSPVKLRSWLLSEGANVRAA